MPYDDLLELIADWIGAGKAYSQGKWDKSTPLNYWIANRDRIWFHKDIYTFIDRCMKKINEVGWDMFVGHLTLGDWKSDY